jgi:hypothetical protein
MKSVANLEIKESTIENAGLGIFAYKPANNRQNGNNIPVFSPNGNGVNSKKIINEYIGEIVTEEELENRYGGDDFTAPYAYRFSAARDELIDPALIRGVGSLANHSLQRPERGDPRVRRTQRDRNNNLLPWANAKFVSSQTIDIVKYF